MASSRNRRPKYVNPTWLTCSDGYKFKSTPPSSMREDKYLTSSNLWERVICVTLQAQSGDFRNVEVLLDVARASDDFSLTDSSLRLFAQSAPSSSVLRLASLFSDSDHFVRLSSYQAAVLSCDLRLAGSLSDHYVDSVIQDREDISTAISDMLEPFNDNMELYEGHEEAYEYRDKVKNKIFQISDIYGKKTAVFGGTVLDLTDLMRRVIHLCEDDCEEYSAVIYGMMSIVEGMTGVLLKGCFDEECNPIMDELTHVINRMNLEIKSKKYNTGVRYFFSNILV